MNLKTISTTLALLGTGTLALTGCDDKKEQPAKEVEKAKADADANVEKAEVDAKDEKADAKADAKGEMSCAEGMCGEGACGGSKKAVHANDQKDGDAAKDAPAADDAAKDKADKS